MITDDNMNSVRTAACEAFDRVYFDTATNQEERLYIALMAALEAALAVAPSKHTCYECDGPLNGPYCPSCDARDAALAGHAAVDGWRPMESAPMNEDVVVFDGEDYAIACFEDWYRPEWVSPDGEPIDITPTHWQPLPAPPKLNAETQEVSDAE